MVDGSAKRLEVGEPQNDGGLLALPPYALARQMGVKCTGCGSSWDDDRLEAERGKRPGLISCCPDRDMVPVYRVQENAGAATSSLADRLDKAAKGAGGLDGDPERAALLAEAAAFARQAVASQPIEDEDADSCGICASGFKADDLCATDIELGIVHAECIAGSPTVNLDSGEEIDGPIATYRYDSLPMPRRGDWMQTYTGRQFWPLDPRAEEVDIVDIAHALSMQCRFAGHSLRFYSVAEHSVLLSHAVEPEHQLWALLHDASEAYLVDVPRPIKPSLTGYREIEDRVMTVVADTFGLEPDMPAAVKEADGRILGDERSWNMARPPAPWADTGLPLGVELRFWSPAQAKTAFLDRFSELMAQLDSRHVEEISR